MLVAASNPCPCGYLGSPERKCTCTVSQIRKYRRKLSGPLMDRIDLFINVPYVRYKKLTSQDEMGHSSKIREEVIKARKIQKERFKEENFFVNSEIPISKIKKYCPIDSRCQDFLKRFVDSGKLSARGYHRVLRLSRTIADLNGSEKISFDHLAEAVSYRAKDIYTP